MAAQDPSALERFRRRLAEGQADDETLIRYEVSGGRRGQQYVEEIEVQGTGAVSVTLEDQLHGVSRRRSDAVRPTREIAEWLQRLEALLENTGDPDVVAFVPDSLVGLVELRHGQVRIGRLFRPDPGADLLSAELVEEQSIDEVLEHVLSVLGKPLDLEGDD